MNALHALAAACRWLMSTVAGVVGVGAHGVDPNGADYLYTPKPPEYRP